MHCADPKQVVTEDKHTSETFLQAQLGLGDARRNSVAEISSKLDLAFLLDEFNKVPISPAIPSACLCVSE